MRPRAHRSRARQPAWRREAPSSSEQDQAVSLLGASSRELLRLSTGCRLGVDLPSARVQQDRETRARDDGVATRLGSCVRRGDWRQQGREQAAWTTLARAKCTRFSKHGKHRRRVNAKEAAACPRLAQMSAAVLRAALGGRGGGWCGCARVDGCEGAQEQGRRQTLESVSVSVASFKAHVVFQYLLFIHLCITVDDLVRLV